MQKENKSILIEGAKVFGIELSTGQVEAFDLFLRELLKWNRKMNLTAIRTEKGIVVKHFLDSLSACPHLCGVSSLLDIGSGAGVPGIPLKIVKPSLEVTLIDSVRKKVDFQNHLLRMLGLKGIEAIHGRIEDRGVLTGREGRFDLVISRAFSDLKMLLTLGFPYLKRGGLLLAMKGEGGPEDVRQSDKTAETRYRFDQSVSFTLPFSSFKRSILVFEKT